MINTMEFLTPAVRDVIYLNALATVAELIQALQFFACMAVGKSSGVVVFTVVFAVFSQ